MKTKATILLTLFISLLTLSMFSQSLDPESDGDFEWTGAWPYGTSAAAAVDTSRDYAFLASGGAVLTLDISDPADPVQLNKSIRTAGQVLDIHMDYENQNLLLACDEAGMEIWDVDNVNDPSRLSKLEIMYGGVETPVRHIEKYNDYAVTENRWGYVHTIDISDPEDPFQVGYNGVMGNPAHDISVSSDGYIHASGQQYFVLLEINADGTLNLAANYYYVAGSVYGTTEASYLSVNNSLLIHSRTGGGNGSTSATFHDIVVRNDTAYMIGDSTFMIYDVTDHSNPFFVSETTLSASASQLDIMGDMAYIACGRLGMRLVDFSNPSSPSEYSEFDGTSVSWMSMPHGNYSFLANSSTGVSIIDVTDPTGSSPEKVAGIASSDETRYLDVEDQTLYVADYSAGIKIYDIEDPENPDSLGIIQNINAWRVDVNDDDLFLVNSNPNQPDTLEIYDVSDPANPVMQSEMILPDLIWDMHYYEDHLYIGTNDEGLLIIDVSDPGNPSQVATVDLPDVSDVDIEDDIAWVASTDWDGGLVSIDMSDPENPEIINTYNPSGWYHPFHVAVEGDYVYTSENFGELKMFDASDPADPQLLDEYKTSGNIFHMLANGNNLYVADGPDGLQILHNNLGSVNTDFTADNENVCEGDVINFTDQSSAGVTSWEWTFEGGDPATSTEQNPSVTYNAAGTYDVELTVSDGVSSDTELKEDYITISAAPGQADMPEGPTETCQGEIYEYITGEVSGATSYDWMVNPSDAGSISGNDTIGTFEAAADWTGDYYVKVRATSDCGDGPWSDSLEATLNYIPEQYTLTGGGTYCEGTGGLELILDGSETGVDYELFRDSFTTGIITAGTGDSLSFGYQTEEGFYTVAGFTETCTRDMAGENEIIKETLPEQPETPEGEQMACNGDVNEYTSAGSPNADTYTWMLSPDNAGTLSSDSLTAEVDWNSEYTGSAMLSLYGTNECGDGPESEELVISVGMSPEQPEITGEDTACPNIITTYITEEHPGNSFNWEAENGTIYEGDSINIASVLWGEPGMGKLTVTEITSEGCATTSDTLEVHIIECVGVTDEPAERIALYPNPVEEKLNIMLEEESTTVIRISIYDMLGGKADEKSFEPGGTHYRYDVSKFEPGVYTIRLSDRNGLLMTDKFVKN
ncbi:MAG: PKD domain-containing protein [Bacteroidales bacterium]|nr:PKD domain-containing protein [Bacteroidales bacterium]MCF8349694.1 PKD domain-containing protein [Bacteroidales bacterium]MCF8376572.1 PKD domain-containing protein [Bacteroidales bacterium]